MNCLLVQGCTALNSVESMQQLLSRLDEMLQFELLHEKLVQQLQNEQQAKLTSHGLHELINNASSKMDMSQSAIVAHIANKLQGDIKKYVFNVCWAPRSMQPDAAVASLVTFCRSTASQFQSELQGRLLVRALSAFWAQLLKHFDEQVEKEASELERAAGLADQRPGSSSSSCSPQQAQPPPTFLRVTDSATLNGLGLSPLGSRRSLGFGSVSTRADSAYCSEHASVSASVTNSSGVFAAGNAACLASPSPYACPGFDGALNSASVGGASAATQDALMTLSLICSRLSTAVRVLFDFFFSVCDKATPGAADCLKSDLYKVGALRFNQSPVAASDLS